MKVLSFLTVLLLAACSTEPAANLQSQALIDPAEKHFYLTRAVADPDLANVPSKPTSGIVSVNVENDSLDMTLVYGLFPFFYKTELEKTYTDACGSVHYIGRATNPEGRRDRELSIHLINHYGNLCIDGPRKLAYALLETQRENGKKTTSHLYFSIDNPDEPLKCSGTKQLNEFQSTEYEVELPYFIDREGQIDDSSNIRVRTRSIDLRALQNGPWVTIVNLSAAEVKKLAAGGYAVNFSAGNLQLGFDRPFAGTLDLQIASQTNEVAVSCSK